MSTLSDDVQRDVDALLESRVFVISSPPKLGLTRERGAHGASGCYLEIPLRWDRNDTEYDRQLGETRVDLTQDGLAALRAAIGECPHCNRPMAEGELH